MANYVQKTLGLALDLTKTGLLARTLTGSLAYSWDECLGISPS